MSVRPGIYSVAFDCPHCGAYTSQTWFQLLAESVGKDQRTPYIVTRMQLAEFLESPEFDEETKRRYEEDAAKDLSGLVFLRRRTDAMPTSAGVANLHLSRCYACAKMAVWVYDRLMFPTVMEADPPNPDLPEDVRFDYEEAGRIVSESPRGAAALLRLALRFSG